MSAPTWVPLLDVSAYTALTFVAGHVLFSICAPGALVEALAPRLRNHEWLSTSALVAVIVAYLLSAALILRDHVASQHFVASVGQLLGAAGLTAGLVCPGASTRATSDLPSSRSCRTAVGGWWVGSAAGGLAQPAGR